MGVISIDVDVETAPPVEALIDDEAPVADERAESLAGLMGRNEAILIYRSLGAPDNADGGEAGNVPVNEATSCDAVLDKRPLDPEGKTLGEFGVTSTNVAVLEVLLADVGLVRVKSVAEEVLLRLRRRAFNPLSDRSGMESLRGGVLEPPRFPKRDVPRAGKALSPQTSSIGIILSVPGFSNYHYPNHLSFVQS